MVEAVSVTDPSLPPIRNAACAYCAIVIDEAEADPAPPFTDDERHAPDLAAGTDGEFLILMAAMGSLIGSRGGSARTTGTSERER